MSSNCEGVTNEVRVEGEPEESERRRGMVGLSNRSASNPYASHSLMDIAAFLYATTCLSSTPSID